MPDWERLFVFCCGQIFFEILVMFFGNLWYTANMVINTNYICMGVCNNSHRSLYVLQQILIICKKQFKSLFIPELKYLWISTFWEMEFYCFLHRNPSTYRILMIVVLCSWSEITKKSYVNKIAQPTLNLLICIHSPCQIYASSSTMMLPSHTMSFSLTSQHLPS